MSSDPLPRLRGICLALAEAREVTAWGEPTFRVRNKQFAMYASPHTHHGNGRPSVWCKSTVENQELMIAAAPHRFFVPPYVGASGWVGIWLDRRPRWREIDEILADAHRLVAPKRLLASDDALVIRRMRRRR